MICISIGEKTVEDVVRALRGVEFAEVRIDLLDRPSTEGVRQIFTGRPRLIATCRPGRLGESEREALLMAAIDSGAAMVDVEVEGPDDYKERVVARARSRGCQVIVSYHNHEKTPPAEELRQIAGWCFSCGASTVKIACFCRDGRDAARLLGMLDTDKSMVVVGMGPAGRITRIAGPLLGGAFTFASAGEGRETAPGQMDAGSLRKAIEALRTGSTGREGDD